MIRNNKELPNHPITESSTHPINGWLILDKPEGITSAKAVHLVKKLTGANKIGHAGTLDPFASGILPLALGEGTKVMQFAIQTEKEYLFTLEFGKETDTLDREGAYTKSGGRIPKKEQIEKMLPSFIGEIMQMPPSYSAIKVNGKRSYDLAREGKAVELKSRPVIIHTLQLISYEPPFLTLKMACGKGTYVRSVARDLAYKLDTYAYVKTLRRMLVGKFNEKNAISLEKLNELVHIARLNECILPVETVLDDIPVIDLESDIAGRLKHGQQIKIPNKVEGRIIAARSCGSLVAICETMGGMLKPVRVFNL